MIVTISQPRYLPWLGYFHRIASSDVFVILDTVQYSPRDWENRNRVKTDRGALWLTVPVRAPHRALIPDVLVDNVTPWARKHWRTLATFYKDAPFFAEYETALRETYEQRTWERLLDLALHLISLHCGWLNIDRTRFVRASQLGVSAAGSQLMLELCRAIRGTIYLSGPLGRNYLDESAFARAGIRVAYHDFVHPVYPQRFGEFIPGLAALDLLMNAGHDSRRVLDSAVPCTT
jgi:hypothetical protein